MVKKTKTFLFPIIYTFVEFVATKVGVFFQKKSFDLLLIRMDRIGDWVLFQDALKEIKHRYEGQKVLLVCQKWVIDFVEQDLFFSKIECIDALRFTKNPFYALHVLLRISHYSFSDVFSIFHSRTLAADSIIKIVKAKKKIGFPADDYNHYIKTAQTYDKYYTQLVSTDSSKHVFYQYQDFIRQTINPNYTMQLPTLDLELPEVNIESTRYCLFMVGASDIRRSWPTNKFIELVSLIPDDIDIVLVGHGEAERQRCEAISTVHRKNGRILDYCGKFSILKLCSVIKSALFVVCNDSSGAHLAPALKVKTFVIATGAHWGLCVPYDESLCTNPYFPTVVNKEKSCFRCNWNCPYDLEQGSTKCMGEVSVDEVFEKINHYLYSI
ncbi:MAG: glycosyltransferase family 9 protein [Bacteroidales bacterium]|nr:glycosyltransferase family 9 protein [Bacteroidales bacterium]